MKKKILALTLSAALLLSSTSVFAADCTQSISANSTNYSYLQTLINKLKLENSNISKITINGKTYYLNTKPATTTTVATKPATTTTTPVATKPATTTTAVATKPATTATAPVATQPAATSNTTVSSSNLTYEQKVAELVNIERKNAGLAPLTLDTAISNVARLKSQDMAKNNYFAHQSPTYGSAGDMLTKYGIKWSAWGENIASGQKTPEAVVTAWMNSPGHRANIMSANFTKLGVGYATNANGTPYWTQMFTN